MKTMKLFPYQRAAVADLVRMFRRRRRVLMVSPTSSGKTVMAVHFLKRYPKTRVLWVTHRLILLRQAREQLVAAGVPVSDIGMFTGVEKQNPDARILLASVDMWRQRQLPAGIKWIVIDEAHRAAAASYRAIVDEAPKARLLGLTATPIRMDRSPLGDLFDELLVAATPTLLMQAGFLPIPKCYGIEEGRARAITKSLKSGGGDYTPSSAAKAMRTMYGDIVAEVKRLSDGKGTLVFAVDRVHGERLRKRFLAARLKAEYIDGLTDDVERTAIIGRLESGETQIVVNIEVLCEGFDCPPVKCVVLARPTRSLTRLLQQCGRAGRKYKGQTPIIIDSAGNFTRFPLPDFDYEWSLTDEGAAPKKSGGAPTKTCCNAKCRLRIAASCRECPGCGKKQPVEERELEEQRARLVELKMSHAEIARRRSVIISISKKNRWSDRQLNKAIELWCA